MRFTTLQLAALATAALLAFAYSSGPTGRAGDKTGSPLTSGTQCSGCHQGGSFDPVTSITLEADGMSLDTYVPGQTYTVRIEVDPAVGIPGAYGFQAVALDANDGGAGSFGAAPDNFKVTPNGGREYLEHSRRQTSSFVEIDWTAPAAGTGAVTFYAAGNAADGTGGTSNDAVAFASLALAEGVVSSAFEGRLADAAWRAYVTAPGRLAVDATGLDAGPIDLRITSIHGATLLSQRLSGGALTLVDVPGTTAAAPIVVSLQTADGRRGSRLLLL